MQIGKFDLSRYPIILAPMDGITDKVFRKICKEMGATLTYSEFVSADAIIRNVKVSFDKISKNEDEFPFVVQIFGNDPEIMGQAAKLVESAGADIIDLNFGCPMKKIVSKGAGAALLKNPELMLEITKNVVKSVNVPVTVKTRLGWDETSIIIDNIARGLQDCGIAALTLHARTRRQLYSGNADWDYFLKLKSDPSFSIPLIANGDVDNPEKAKLLFDDYGVDGVMIGRAAIGNPWIFRDCNDYILKNISPKPISINERLAICERHLNELAAMKNEKVAIIEIRKFFKNYFKGIANIKQYRVALLEATSLEEIHSIFNDIKNILKKKYK